MPEPPSETGGVTKSCMEFVLGENGLGAVKPVGTEIEEIDNDSLAWAGEYVGMRAQRRAKTIVIDSRFTLADLICNTFCLSHTSSDNRIFESLALGY
jgi:hypothetical protein